MQSPCALTGKPAYARGQSGQMELASEAVRLQQVNHPISRWTFFDFDSATRRQQSQGVGSTYDGSYGVDSQDIMNIPGISFGTFQLFPDQQSYSSYNNVVSQGNSWITNQAQSASACVVSPLHLLGVHPVQRWEARNHDFVRFGYAKQCGRFCALQLDHSSIWIDFL